MTARVLDGKVAIVTGAAMGMGEATARVFAAAGAHVLVSDINEGLGEATAERIQQDGGVALCLKYEIAQMLEQGDGGAIVNIGSVSSFRPQPNNAAYTAAKHAVIGLTKVASLENAPRGIRVNTVCPGAIDTPMIRGALETVGMTEAEFAPQISLLGRFGQPHEVAQASLWLCSDQSSYVTGAALAVDAGYTSR